MKRERNNQLESAITARDAVIEKCRVALEDASKVFIAITLPDWEAQCKEALAAIAALTKPHEQKEG